MLAWPQGLLHCGRNTVLTVQCTVDSRAGLLLHWCCTATRRRCNFVAIPWLTLMTHVSEMSDLQCLTLNWRTRVSPGSRDNETWGNCHCSAPATSRDCNSRTVRLPQARSFNSVRFPPNCPAVVLSPRKSFNSSRETSIAVHLSSAEPSSSFLRKCPPSLSASTVLDWSVCRVRMNPHCFLDQAHFAVPFG